MWCCLGNHVARARPQMLPRVHSRLFSKQPCSLSSRKHIKSPEKQHVHCCYQPPAKKSHLSFLLEPCASVHAFWSGACQWSNAWTFLICRRFVIVVVVLVLDRLGTCAFYPQKSLWVCIKNEAFAPSFILPLLLKLVRSLEVVLVFFKWVPMAGMFHWFALHNHRGR